MRLPGLLSVGGLLILILAAAAACCRPGPGLPLLAPPLPHGDSAALATGLIPAIAMRPCRSLGTGGEGLAAHTRTRRPHTYTRGEGLAAHARTPLRVQGKAWWVKFRCPHTYTFACSGQGIAASHARAFRFVSIFCRSALYTSVYSTPGRHRVGSRSCAWGCALHAAPHPTPLFTLRSALRTSLYSAHCRLLPLFTPPCAPLRTLRLPLLPSALHPLRALRLPLLPSALQSSLDSTPPFTRHSHLPYTHLHSFTLH